MRVLVRAVAGLKRWYGLKGTAGLILSMPMEWLKGLKRVWFGRSCRADPHDDSAATERVKEVGEGMELVAVG